MKSNKDLQQKLESQLRQPLLDRNEKTPAPASPSTSPSRRPSYGSNLSVSDRTSTSSLSSTSSSYSINNDNNESPNETSNNSLQFEIEIPEQNLVHAIPSTDDEGEFRQQITGEDDDNELLKAITNLKTLQSLAPGEKRSDKDRQTDEQCTKQMTGLLNRLLKDCESDAKKALLEATNNDGKTALILAAERGYAGIVSLLIEYGANPNTKNTSSQAMRGMDENAFQAAVSGAHWDVVKILLKSGAHVSLIVDVMTDNEKILLFLNGPIQLSRAPNLYRALVAGKQGEHDAIMKKYGSPDGEKVTSAAMQTCILKNVDALSGDRAAQMKILNQALDITGSLMKKANNPLAQYVLDHKMLKTALEDKKGEVLKAAANEATNSSSAKQHTGNSKPRF